MSLSIRTIAATAFALGLMATPVFSSKAWAQDAATIARAEQVRDRAMAGNIALDYVTQLTTRFGPRPASSTVGSS